MVKRKIVFRQKKRQNRFSMVLVMIAVLMVLVVVSLRSVDLKRKQEYYGAQIEQLERQIEEETQRTAEIEEYEKYTKTRKYVEEVAKDKLGLVYEGEIIFKPEEKAVSREGAAFFVRQERNFPAEQKNAIMRIVF